jgi:hypothetical protein
MNSQASRHPTVTVNVGPWSEEIDEQIAPLIHEIWTAGIETLMSCQHDGFGMIWIEFPHVEELIKFLDLVAEFSPERECMYNRINQYWRSSDLDLDWIFDLHLADAAFPDREDPSVSVGSHETRGSAFYFTVSLRFPPLDLPNILERLRQFNHARHSPPSGG